MKKSALLAIFGAIFFLNGTSLHAQIIKVTFPPGYNVIVQGDRIPGVEGSQYLSEEWTKGRITLNNGNIIDSIDLRLNAHRNEMHYLAKGVEYSIGTPENIKNIAMGNRNIVYYPNLKGAPISNSYFEVLVEGKIELLVQYYTTIKRSNYNVALDYGDKNDRLILSERYFLKTGTTIVEHDKKGKNLTTSIGDKNSIIKSKIKEENLSFKKKEDLIKIVSYFNTLN